MFLKYIVLVFLNVVLISSLEEGDKCDNIDKTVGVCRVIKKCKWAVDGVAQKKFSPANFVRCGFKGSDPIICCKDEQPAPVDLQISTPKVVSDVWETVPRKAIQACTQIKNIPRPLLSFHILGGKATDKGEFPHQVALGYGDDIESEKITFDCGGSLISKNFVLTAAHCANRKNMQPKVVLLGKTSISQADELTKTEIPVKKVTLHPNYTARKTYDDIALIEMVSPVTYGEFIRPACLYTKTTMLTETGIITGFGIIDTNTLQKSDWLLKADVNEVPLEECKTKYTTYITSKLPDNLKQSQMCATGKNDAGETTDTCQGDSGGPLQIKGLYNQETFYTIAGVTSFGPSCGSQYPGVYTRVAEYINWIEQIVWPDTKVDIN